MKKMYVTVVLLIAMAVMSMASCSGSGGSITVVSREDGSGTRGAFTELFGIIVKNEAGEKIDMTADSAEITNSTAVMITTVEGNADAIGYISLGSQNSSVKTLRVDGVEATADNIRNGSYKYSRPFNIVTQNLQNPAAIDFINFIMSDEGQAVIEDAGYIAAGAEGAYTPGAASGSVTVAGSSSVAPVMEKLREAYIALNPEVDVAVQQSDSTTGINSVIDNVCDIGMASRELKSSELEAGLTPKVIAIDGIAVIVNKDNPISDITGEQVRQIFTGEATSWDSVK